MKKILLIILTSVIFISLIFVYLNQNEFKNTTTIDDAVGEVVWNQLDSTSKEQTIWQASTVSKVILQSNGSNIINDKSYINKEVYLIYFPLKGISYPRNMSVYAALDDYKIIGYLLLD